MTSYDNVRYRKNPNEYYVCVYHTTRYTCTSVKKMFLECVNFISKKIRMSITQMHMLFMQMHTQSFFFLNNKQQTESPFVSRGKLHACFKKKFLTYTSVCM